jgi:helix-turn-helix protein
MSNNTEKKIEDTQGKYLHAIKGGRELTDAEWENCRIILTNQRLMIVTDERLPIPLEKIDVLDERVDINRNAASESYYTALDVGDDVILVTTADYEGFRTNFFRAILDEAVIYVKHPAVLGGVVKPTEWQRGRLKITQDTVRMVLEDGQKFVIERDDIGDMVLDERSVVGEKRGVIEVEHTNEDGTSVETYLSGRQYHISVLKQLLEEGAKQNRADLDLTATEQRVVMALYSGVSPFAISDFVGSDVERVEEIYEQLLELDVIRAVRKRKEVSLTPKGRKVAGEAMGEQ